MGIADSAEVRRVLGMTHAGAVQYSEKAHWGDSSNKLSWLIPELAALFPDAKFVHLVRDGRKVASSYFHKLGAECYDDRSTAILRTYFDDPSRFTMPPPEKKYWWPLPRHCDPMASAFGTFCQFQRIAWHWSEINRVILQDLKEIPAQHSRFARLEDLRESPEALRELYGFLDLPYRDSNFSMFERPHNVNRPRDSLLTHVQRGQFEAIAGPMLERLGYAAREEYVVNY
jgi:hypothetical protein